MRLVDWLMVKQNLKLAEKLIDEGYQTNDGIEFTREKINGETDIVWIEVSPKEC